jgi:hypothetical protein
MRADRMVPCVAAVGIHLCPYIGANCQDTDQAVCRCVGPNLPVDLLHGNNYWFFNKATIMVAPVQSSTGSDRFSSDSKFTSRLACIAWTM